MSEPLVLASRWPRRRTILEQLGIPFTVAVPEVPELTEGDPRELVLKNARRKTTAVDGGFVLGVDTEVVLDGRALGKPADRTTRRRCCAPSPAASTRCSAGWR